MTLEFQVHAPERPGDVHEYINPSIHLVPLFLWTYKTNDTQLQPSHPLQHCTYTSQV